MRGDLASKELLHIELNQSAVKAIKVSAVNADGKYTIGERLEFIVDFSDAVTVFGDTYLPIRTNAGIRKAEYLSGSGTRSLHFVHTIAAGDDALKLENDAVLGGALSDKVGLSVAGALPLAGSGGTLKESHSIAVDTIPPTAPFSVGFDNTLISTGNFNLSWGAGTDLHFQDHLVKLCSDSSCSASCSTAGAEAGISKSFTSISEGTYYGCVQSRDTTGLLSAWASTLTPITIDATGPSIVRVYAPNGDSSFKEGQAVQIAIEFNEFVQALGTSDIRLKLETGLIDRAASYLSGTGTRTLVFSYVVQTGDESQDLNYLDTDSLELGATGSIRDLLSNPATLNLPATNALLSLAGQNQLIVDTTSPGAVPSVDFASPISTSTNLSFTFGASADLNFKHYNVKLCSANDCNSSCGTVATRLASPATLVGTDGGSFFACVQGEDSVGHLSPWVPSSSAVLVDSTAPTVVQVSSSTASGIYKAAQNIDITVEFSEAVTVANSAGLRLLLETGTTDREAAYTSGSGSAVLTFTYTIQVGDVSSDLNYQSSAALILGGATIQDAVGLNASVALPALGSGQSLASNRALRIDTQVPSNPSVVAFDTTLSNSTNLSLSWTPSTDVHFDHHNVKLCSDNLCSTDCVSPTTTAGSSASLTGVDGDVYYACVQGEDSVGQTSAWVASSLSATIDMTAPTVIELDSTLADGLYTSGTDVDIQVKFSKIVNVTVPGDLSLTLNTTPIQYASYQSGSGTDTLTFRYTVSAGDTASDLGYSDQASLVIGGGTIRDLAGNQAVLGLPALLSASSLQGQKAIVIDTTVPVSPSSVGFGTTLVNSPSFPMSWDESTDLHFQTHNLKLCASSDCVSSCTSELTSATSPMTMVGISGSTYFGCVQGEDSLGLKSPWIPSVGSITIDSAFPTVTNVTSSHANGSFKVGEAISLQISFSKNVYVTNSGDIGLTLETGATDRVASYTGGDGTNTLSFSYTVQAGDTSSDLDYAGINALDLGASGTIRDLAGSSAALDLPAIGSPQSLAIQKAIRIDTSNPAAPLITSPADASFESTAVTVIAGTSEAGDQIELKDGATVLGTTTAVGTNWSITLNPAYTDGIYALTAKATDSAGNESPSSGAHSFVIDTSAPNAPVIQALTTPSVNQTPVLNGTSEANVAIKIYSNGVLLTTIAASPATSWTYNVPALPDGNYSFTAEAVDAANRTSPSSTAVPYSVDTVNPTAPVSPTFAGTVTNSTSIPLTWVTNSSDVHFKQHNAMLCTDSACSLGCISTTQVASSPATLLGVDTGNYYGCVQGEDDLGHLSAWIATPSPILVDATEATVTGVTSSTVNDVYTTGETISIAVTFSKDVYVTGGSNLRLKLETGATDRDATYVSGSGSSVLLFTYTVANGDNSNDLNYESTGALTLNGDLIRDIATNNANLTLPPLAGVSSLAGSKALKLDTTAPTAASMVGFTGVLTNSPSFTMSWTAGSDANLVGYNSKICTDAACSTDCLSLTTAAPISRTVTGSAGSTYYGCVQTVDAVGLMSAWINSVSTMTIDSAAPTVTNVTSSLADGSYKAGQIIPIQLTFSELVNVTSGSEVKLSLETGATDREAVYASGSGTNTLVFQYTVQAGDASTDLSYVGTASLSVSGAGAIKDNATNNANLSLPALGSATSLAFQKAINIDTTPPVAPVVVTPAHNAYSMIPITTVTGTSEANAIITLKDGATTIGTTTAVGTDWSITLGTALSDGLYTLSATARDAAGNIGVDSSVNSVRVDTTGPNAPVIAALVSPNSDSTPTISGTAELSTEVKVYSGATLLGWVMTDAFGSWSLASNLLADGPYSITATATDPGARVSPVSTAVPITIDTTAPSVPSNAAFATANSNSTSLAITWTASTDVHFEHHEAKLCTNADCATGCLTSSTTTGNSLSLTGANGSTYRACVRAKDTLGLFSAWHVSAGSSKIDLNQPTVSSVSTTKADGFYKNGTVDVSILFSEAVVVTTPADLSLLMETGTTDRAATYVSGSGSNTLVFSYAVTAGDTSADLDYASTAALALGSAGVIADLAGNNAVLALPAPGAVGSLSNGRAVVIDTTVPVAPSLPVFPYTTTNLTSFNLSWTAGSDTNLQGYRTKLCTNAACTTACVDEQTTSVLSQTKSGSAGATYYGCVQSEDRAVNLSAWVASAQTITIDQVAPTITNISSSKANGAYKVGESIPIAVTFNKIVNVTGTAQFTFTMETGATDRIASFVSGGGSTILNFNYVVQAGDTAADLGEASFGTGTGTIRDNSGNDADLTLPALGAANSMRFQKAIVIDTTAPAAPVIVTPAHNAYITATLTTVSGTSEAGALITIKQGATTIGTATANGSGAWSSTLSASLTDGSYSLTATAQDAATNLSATSAANSITVDNSPPAVPVIVTAVTPTNDTTPTISGTSDANAIIKLFADGNQVGTVTANGSGAWSITSNALTHGSYTLTATATDGGGRESAASASAPITIDTVLPTISGVTSSLGNGTYGVGQVVPVAVTFSEAVTVTGTPTLLMETGTTDTSASYASGSPGATLIFNYTVVAGNLTADLAYQSNAALSGTIKDAAGNNATLTLPALGAAGSLNANKAIAIDANIATISAVTSAKANGTYGIGHVIDITINFSRNVNVTGTPVLALNTTPARNASYLSGTGTAQLTFRYTVASPHVSTDLEYTSTSALSGGTIKDVIANDANLTLPTLATGNSLGGSKALVIAGNSATPVLSASTAATNAYVGTAITPVNVNNSTGNDLTNDSRVITYTCFYDTTVNATMDSGGTACSSLPGSSVNFNSSTGVLTWTPSSASQAAYNTAQNYEFQVVGTSTANVSGSVIFTARVIRPWSNSYTYDSADAANYTFPASMIEITGGGIARLIKADQDDLQYDSWGGNTDGASKLGAPYWSLLNGAYGFCHGGAMNCFGAVDDQWLPRKANLLTMHTFESGSSVAGQFTNPDPTGPSVPALMNTAQKTWYQSAYFDGGDWLYVPRNIQDDFTVNLWIKTSQTIAESDCSNFSHGAGLMSTEVAGNANDWGLSLCDGYIAAGSGSTTATTGMRSKHRFNDNRWHMVTFTRVRATGVMKLYIDGLLHATATGGTASLTASTNIFVGTIAGDASNFIGNMDDVAFWNVTLADSEVQTIFELQNPRGGNFKSRIMDSLSLTPDWASIRVTMNQPWGKELPDNAVSETTADYPTVPANLMTGIKGLWHFNETSGAFMDRSGNGVNPGVAGTLGQPGRFNKSTHLNGTGQHINLGDHTPSNFGTGSFTSSVWMRTSASYATGSAGRIFSNGAYGLSTGWSVRVFEKYANFVLGCTGVQANCLSIRGSTEITDNKWHHIMTVVDKTANRVRLYVDGVQQTPIYQGTSTCGSITGNDVDISSCSLLNADRSSNFTFLGTHGNFAEFYEGHIDEFAIWNRALNAAEAKHLFTRGALRPLIQVRTCTASNCLDDFTGVNWKGPDGTINTFFSEIHNNTVPSTQTGLVQAGKLTISFADYGLTVTPNRYFQYRIFMQSDDNNNLCNYGAAASCSPEIVSVEVGPDHYPTLAAITRNASVSFYTINTLSAVIGAGGCSAGLRYQLSVNGTNFYYHNGTTWVSDGGTVTLAKTNTTASLVATLPDFANMVGRTGLYVRTLLSSTSATPCEVDSVSITGNASF